MKTRILITALALSVATPLLARSGGSLPQTTPKHATLPAATQTFLRTAAEGGQSEVDLANLALSKTSNDQVKQLAMTIKSDHEAANAELKSLASQKQLTLPSTTTRAEKSTSAQLTKLSGPAFDKAYVTDMVKDHQADIAEFQKHQHDSDGDVAAWVTKTLPALQNHLKLAQSAQQAIGK